MNQSRSRLVDLAGLLSNVTALHTLFSIFAFRQTGRSDPAGLLIWCVCLSLTCGGLALFLRRPRTQRSILLLALAALALQGAVVWLWGVRYPSLLSWLCLLAMWGFSYFRCYELLIRPTPAEQLMVSFETASLVLLAAALCTAARSGVDVRIMTPHIPDKKVVFAVTRSNYPTLLEAGARIYEFTPGFLHSKTVVADDLYASVGSCNLDYRSFYLQFENGVWLCGDPAVLEVRDDFLQTMEVCQEITQNDCKTLSLFSRLLRSIYRLFAPLF